MKKELIQVVELGGANNIEYTLYKEYPNEESTVVLLEEKKLFKHQVIVHLKNGVKIVIYNPCAILYREVNK